MDSILLKDYPYEVYADGTIYRTERKSKNGRRNLKRLQICPHKVTNGYMVVKLFCPQEGRYKNIYLHRLLYSCFVGDITGLEIDHWDTNKENNDLDNLRAVSHQSNCNNPNSIERYKKANALSAGKFNRDKMQAAKSKDYYQKLVRTYKRLVKKHGYCGVWMLMKVGHCGYPRAKRIITEMQGENDKHQ
jgi:hypothetical protein